MPFYERVWSAAREDRVWFEEKVASVRWVEWCGG